MNRGGDLVGPSLWLFGATAVSNACNFLYHLYMVRSLSPEHYAMLTALLALMTIIGVPSATVQTTTSHRCSQLAAQGDWMTLRADLRRQFVLATAAAAFGFLLIAGLHQAVAAYLQFSDLPHVVLSWGGAVAAAFILPIGWGALQGLQAFRSLGVNLALNSALKLLLGMVFVVLGWQVLGAMNGLLLAIAATFVLVLAQISLVLRTRHPQGSSSNPWWARAMTWTADGINEGWLMLRQPPTVSGYAILVALSVMAYTSLTNVDVVLVKHYFDPVVAGRYAVGAMVSRSVLFLPMALSMVLFPKVAHAIAVGQNPKPLLGKALAATACLSGLACTVCLVAPELTMRVLAGTVFPEAVPIIRLLAVAMACMATANLVLVYALAAQQYRWTVPFLIAAIVHVAGIATWHTRLTDIATMTLAVSAALAILAPLLVRHPMAPCASSS